MDSYKPDALKDRKSQNLDFGDYARERLLWGVLPVVAGGAAVAFRRVTKTQVWPLDGSPDFITMMHAFVAEKMLGQDKEEVSKWVIRGGWAGGLIDALGGENKEEIRKDFFNFTKGAEVVAPFSAYHLWHQREGKRLDLQEASGTLIGLEGLKPTDADLKLQNEVMKKEIAFAAQQGAIPKAAIEPQSLTSQGRVSGQAKGRSQS